MMKIIMKHMLSRGFALPTLLIASVIMLTVLLASVTAVSSITGGINSQYYNQLAREAAESGLANAETCLRANNYSPTWTDASPLRPFTNCNGTTQAGFPQYVFQSGNVRTTFTVKRPTTGDASTLFIVSEGKVELTRTSDPSQIWRSYTVTVGNTSRYNDAPQIAGGAGWKDLGHNGYMLATTGILYGWGDNTYNQLGASSLGTTVSTPIVMDLPSGVTRAKKVFNSGQGASVLCIIATHSSLGDQAYCRGLGLGLSYSGWVQFGLSAGLTALDMSLNGYGGDSACVKASDLQAYCVGINDSGGLGRATNSAAFVPITSPVKFRLDLANPGPVSGSASSLTVKKVYTQDRSTCVIASDDQAYCAGDNYMGQLGQGNFNTNVWVGKSTPGRALISGNPPIAEVTLSYHGAIEGIFFRSASDGTVYMSGFNGNGTANDGGFSGSCSNGYGYNCYNTPRVITSPGFGKVISVGEQGQDRHGICVVGISPPGDSGLWCLGQSGYGQMGAGDCVDRAWFYGPVAVGGEVVNYQALGPEAVYQMNSVTLITTAGNAYSAGDNTYGKLGTGASLGSCRPNFTKVQLPAGVKAQAVANGDEYTTFILGDNGKIYSMGRNHNGQLGNGTTTNSNVPVEVKLPRQETVF